MPNIESRETEFFKRFYNILLEESSLLSRVLLLEREKSDAFAKSGSFIDLSSYNAELELISKQQAVLEGQRLSCLGEFSVLRGVEVKTLKDVLLFVPLNLKESYLELEDKLRVLVEEIKFVSSSNAVIIEDSLKLLGYGLSMFSEDQELEINYKERDKPSTRYKPIVINTVI